MSRHVTMFSAGGGSWRTAMIVQSRLPAGDTHELLFTDVLYEDADAYRFLVEGAARVFGRELSFKVPAAVDFPDYRVADDVPLEEYAGNPEWRAFLSDLRAAAVSEIPELVWLVEGRDPWETMRDKRFLGNSLVDPCSYEGKRTVADRWRKEECDPAASIFYVGIGEEEKHRFERLQPRMAAAGWDYRAPLVGRIDSHLNPAFFIRAAGLVEPRLYVMGYVHNNCGGFCIKAGHAHYQNRFRVQPERFAYDAMMERKMRAFLGADVAMLTDRVGGEKRPMTLDEFGARLAANPQQDFFYDNDSGCGCMLEI